MEVTFCVSGLSYQLLVVDRVKLFHSEPVCRADFMDVPKTRFFLQQEYVSARICFTFNRPI